MAKDQRKPPATAELVGNGRAAAEASTIGVARYFG
jgi:hypothetical protein